ncbi:hypothetical protein CA13_28010 [Planctomycetes bacterium CA13]|uniref:DUF8051 domain-containing protein n=1 Tax=Novipirellula herctigrandis TaxID=2527986 RepID=A0A5C5Z1X9_9BACT|nr:hypothetical protein CA13_28010 [Planctomycetes bacterium CA13]
MNDAKQKHGIFLTTSLLLSFALLASLVPGGPIQFGDFSHFKPAVLASFNVFLTSLGIASVVAAFLL